MAILADSALGVSLPDLREWSNAGHPRPELQFRLRMPTTAICGKSTRDTPSRSRPLVDLAWFRIPDAATPVEILVQATAVEHEIFLRDYLQQWAKFGGEEVLELDLEEGDPERPGFWLQRVHPDGQTWLTRRTAFKVWNGSVGEVVTVNAACPLERGVFCRSLLEAIAASFEPVHRAGHRLAEILRLVSRGAPLDFATYLPVSWQELPHRHDQAGHARFTFLRKLRGITSGVLSIITADKTEFANSDDFLLEAISTWQPFGIDPRKIAFEPVPGPRPGRTVRGAIAMPARDGSGGDALSLELLCTEFGSHWFHAEVIGPSAGRDFEAWAINHRTLDLFARNLKTVEGSSSSKPE